MHAREQHENGASLSNLPFLDMQVDAAILVLDLFIQKVQLFSSYIIEEVHNIGSSANVVMERKEVVGGG